MRNHSQTSAGHFREAATNPLALLKDPPPPAGKPGRDAPASDRAGMRRGKRGESPEISGVPLPADRLARSHPHSPIPVSIPGSENCPSPTSARFNRIREQGTGRVCKARLSSLWFVSAGQLVSGRRRTGLRAPDFQDSAPVTEQGLNSALKGRNDSRLNTSLCCGHACTNVFTHNTHMKPCCTHTYTDTHTCAQAHTLLPPQMRILRDWPIFIFLKEMR